MSKNVDREHCVSIFNLKVLEEGFEVVFGGEAGVGEVAGAWSQRSCIPYRQVINKFAFLFDTS